MKTIRRQILLTAALLCVLALTNAYATDFSSEELQQRMLERRNIW